MKRKHWLSLVVVALAGLVGLQAFAGDGDREDTPADPPISISSAF